MKFSNHQKPNCTTKIRNLLKKVVKKKRKNIAILNVNLIYIKCLPLLLKVNVAIPYTRNNQKKNKDRNQNYTSEIQDISKVRYYKYNKKDYYANKFIEPPKN